MYVFVAAVTAKLRTQIDDSKRPGSTCGRIVITTSPVQSIGTVL